VHAKPFYFQEFDINHDKNVMPVSTDSVLLGSWVDFFGAEHILDIGCGTGLLSLMAAQRNKTARIRGIDTNRDAVSLAQTNVAQSPWSSRIAIGHQDVLAIEPEITDRFDTLVSNPPYFTSGTAPDDLSRETYRHTSAHFFSQFFSKLHSISTSHATLSIVIPFSMRKRIFAEALQHAWYVKRMLQVRHTERVGYTLCLLEWSKQFDQSKAFVESTTLYQSDGKKTPAYHKMTRAFYLSE
jgi:tRNA1Val (adenine37-N6)-methyltransferase